MALGTAIAVTASVATAPPDPAIAAAEIQAYAEANAQVLDVETVAAHAALETEFSETVGQYDIELGTGTQELEDHDIVIRTFKRPTSVKILACVPR